MFESKEFFFFFFKFLLFKKKKPKILEKKTILSAPVLDSNNKLIGIVDTQQILTFLLGIYPKSIESIQTLTGEGFNEIIQKGKVFSNTPIKEVIGTTIIYDFRIIISFFFFRGA